MAKTLTFWFEFASPYSYLSAMRIETMATERDIEVEWNPFLLGAIFKEDLGYADSPFNKHPKKFAYLWRDLTRLCEQRGLTPVTKPEPFPQNAIAATRAACALRGTPQMGAFVKAIYEAQFQRGEKVNTALIEATFTAAGLDSGHWLARARQSDVKTQLRTLTAEANQKGIFGAPAFTTPDGELFWGDDRLEMALDWVVEMR